MSSEIDLIYREWQEAIRDRFNIKGEQVVVAKPSNPAHLSILKEMCLKAGFTSDEANSIVLILEKFQARKKDTGKVVDFKSKENRDKAIKGGDYEELEQDGDDDASSETNPNFAKDDEKREKGQSTTDGGHLTSKKPEEEKEEKEEKPVSEMSEEELREKDDELVETQLFLFKDDPQDAGGLGTPVSRTGETVTVHAAKKVKKLMADGMSYDDAREQVRQELLEHAKKKNDEGKESLLTEEWVESGLNCLDWIHQNYGLDKIDEVAWDTPAGNRLVGSENHGTSADMFIKTRDGRTIGVSLKKDFKVFIVNGGYGTQLKNLAKMLGVDVKDLPENVQASHYNKRRDEILHEGSNSAVNKLNQPNVKSIIVSEVEKALQSDEEAKRVFGPAYKKRIAHIARKKSGLGETAWKNLTPKERQKYIDSLTGEDVHNHIINDLQTNEDIKVLAQIAKLDEVEKLTNVYSDLRNLDEEVADNLMDFLNQGDNLEKFKELVAEQTHINDILFGSEGEGLAALEVLYGEDGGVSMSPEAVVNLFGVGDLYRQYQNATGDEKEELKKKIQQSVKDKMVIQRSGGKPVIAVRVNVPDPPPDGPIQESILPIFGLATRTKGIGNSNGLEIYQSAFGSLAFKNGNTNVDSWPESDRKTIVNDEVNSITKDIKDENLDPTKEGDLQEIKKRIELLERWNPKNKKLLALKKKYNIE